MADLDTKALEAARDMLRSCKDHREDWLAKCIAAYLSALPKPSEEVAGMVKAIRKYHQADHCGETVLVSRQACDEAATMIEALDAELRALRSPGD